MGRIGLHTKRLRLPERLPKKPLFLALAALLAFVTGLLSLAQEYNVLPQRAYLPQDFNLPLLHSKNDRDGDGVDDYTDLLEGARAYVSARPRYQSGYYQGGYPPSGVGVCTDLIWFAFQHAGYDLKTMVDRDIQLRPEAYTQIEKPDPNIDFRRVYNLNVFFAAYAKSLTCDVNDLAEWQPGDIVVFAHHIAIVSDRRNVDGVAWIIHHGGQPRWEEDAITRYPIVAHYRFYNPGLAAAAGLLS